ncbi:uncharacterized protein LOC110021368 [Phalaenopsis equestris]|uniref:uncharacterized protein LOC110021368 n=1 Tax=Phalaenopsis equestris TaxID=78828 RepID=UPI0009E1E535|nr:uncharacterized protein LOC110021368 [Phalaenopsis equestris]
MRHRSWQCPLQRAPNTIFPCLTSHWLRLRAFSVASSLLRTTLVPSTASPRSADGFSSELESRSPCFSIQDWYQRSHQHYGDNFNYSNERHFVRDFISFHHHRTAY